MKFNKKKAIIILGILAVFSVSFILFRYLKSNQTTSFSITVSVKGIQNKQVYLVLIKGGKKIIIDTVISDRDKIYFEFDKPLQIGLYRVIIDKEDHLDLIFDNTAVVMKTNISDLVAEMEVKRSGENKQYYEYLKYSQKKNLEIFDIVAQAKILQDDSLKNAKRIDSLIKEIDLIIKEKNKFITELASKNPNSVTTRIIKSYILPDFDEFKQKNPATTYKNKNEFLGDHFFDQINFQDTLLLNTDVFYNACNNYIRNFVTADGDGYRKAIDVVMIKSAVNSQVNKYFLDLFVETFEESSWEGVFTYLVDNYYLQSFCEDNDVKVKELKNKTEILKNLSPGCKAPEIKMMDKNNKTHSLYSMNNKLFLLFFWKSDCEYCEESIPELKELYEAYKNKGFEIIGISMDTIQNLWAEALKKHDLKWVSLSDLRGYKSSVSMNYYVWRTPTFYLLDQNKKIISKPISIDQIKKKLDKTLGFSNSNTQKK